LIDCLNYELQGDELIPLISEDAHHRRYGWMISRILFCQTFPFERLPFSGQLCCPVLPGCSMLEAESIDPGIWPFDIVAACKPGARNVVIPHPPAENHLRTKRAENGGPQTQTMV